MKSAQLKQNGMTFIGMVLVIAAIMMIAVTGMKVGPVYMEYSSVKKAIKLINGQGEVTQSSAREQFGRSASVENIKRVSVSDIKVENGKAQVQYEVIVPLFANASILLEFNTAN